jgi:hypothetical protein
MRTLRLTLGVILIAALASVTNAGSITEMWCSFTGPSGDHEWNFDVPTQTMSLTEHIYANEYDSVNMWGNIDDTTFHVTKTVQNTTAFPWIAYQLELIPGGTSPVFVGTPTSDVMTLNTQTPTLALFTEPLQVPINGWVTFDVDIQIPSGASFDFTLRQLATPLPEPASLLLLGLVGLTIRRR